MQKSQPYQYEERFIKSLLDNLANEDKKQAKFGKVKKNDYLKNGVKTCKKLNRKIKRSTFDFNR